MGDRPKNTSRMRTSEDKMCRKDMCWSVRIVCVLVKLPDVSGPDLGEAGRYRMVSKPTLAVSRARGGADATGMWPGAWRVSVRASGMSRWHWTHGRGTWAAGTGRTGCGQERTFLAWD